MWGYVNFDQLLMPKFSQILFHHLLFPFSSYDDVQNQIQNDQYGGVEEGTGTIMEVDSIVVEMVIESIQVAPDTIGATTKIVHPSTVSTIIEIKEGTKNL